MKYTRNDSGEVIEVHGCAKCPHMEFIVKNTGNFMQCRVPTLRGDETYLPKKKKLVGKWTGAYHESCPLSSDPKNVMAIRTEVPK